MSEPVAVYESKQVAQRQDALPATTFDPMRLITLAVEQNADIDKLEKLLALQVRYEANEAKKAFDMAMSAFKGECPAIKKNHTVDFNSQKGRTTYKHATLDNVCGTINPVLGKYGLSYTWDTKQEGGIVSVTCHIAHACGHTTSGVTLSSGLDNSGNKNSIQSIGSTVTYLQRYTLLAALGLSTESDDDDGQDSSEAPQVQHAPAKPAAYPVDAFRDNLPKWRTLIESGKKSPEDVIATVETKGLLTPEQKLLIMDCLPIDGSVEVVQ